MYRLFFTLSILTSTYLLSKAVCLAHALRQDAGKVGNICLIGSYPILIR